MQAARVRIGKVRLRNGAELRQVPALKRDDLQRDMVRSAAQAAEAFKAGEIEGYFVCAWDRRGYHSRGYHVKADALIGPTLLPTWVADILRRSMIEAGIWQ